jgi:hypothetical protein
MLDRAAGFPMGVQFLKRLLCTFDFVIVVSVRLLVVTATLSIKIPTFLMLLTNTFAMDTVSVVPQVLVPYTTPCQAGHNAIASWVTCHWTQDSRRLPVHFVVHLFCAKNIFVVKTAQAIVTKSGPSED